MTIRALRLWMYSVLGMRAWLWLWCWLHVADIEDSVARLDEETELMEREMGALMEQLADLHVYLGRRGSRAAESLAWQRILSYDTIQRGTDVEPAGYEESWLSRSLLIMEYNVTAKVTMDTLANVSLFKVAWEAAVTYGGMTHGNAFHKHFTLRNFLKKIIITGKKVK